jgi:formylglycine-generating enzyme required for sulfatase activity
VVIPAGFADLGADPNSVAFGWDNEFDAHAVHVPAFDIDTLPVTNAQYLEFITAGGYTNRELWSDEGWEWIQAEAVAHPAFWLSRPPTSDLRPPISDLQPPTSDLRPPTSDAAWQWRGMFEPLPLPLDWPVYVSHAEASAYARWKGRRLMTEPEFHRAAEGSTTGHFDFAGFDPIPVGSHPPSAAGVYDLIGNGWEWTSTVFAPFEGFVPMASYPEYSADFFDGQHYVMKGASPATAAELVRPSFRNWFRSNYPYVYAKFRTAGL